MQFSVRAAALLALASSAVGYVPEPTEATDLLAKASLQKLTDAATDGSLRKLLATKGVAQDCNVENAAIRREYASLSNDDKLAYTSAVKCLMAKPARTPSSLAPGAKSRYDDFVATHINATNTIHFTGNFLTWHRYFIWSFEKALRDECGYAGFLPYWNWGKSAHDPAGSPYMDGSEYSQGGDGEFQSHGCTPALISGLGCIPPGWGGGCVATGPYAGLRANLSATGPTFPGVPAGRARLGFQPRCVRRDISAWVTRQWSTDAQSADLLANPAYQTGLAAFQDRLQGGNASDIWASRFFGLHTAGHFAWGGDPGGDVANSPNDPMFWLHHAQVDRTWWIWQNQRPLARALLVAGTRTILNFPPSEPATLDDLLDLHYTAPPSELKNHVSSLGGPYCYIYV